MPVAWRIVPARRAGDAFSGQGAAKYGGRWNSRGTALVYVSGTQALAALETLVHLNPFTPLVFKIFRLEFETALVTTLLTAGLPSDWRTEPPPPSTQRLGDAWARAARSVALAVPSVLIPGETNFLLNPAHADFVRITIGPPADFAFDQRLVS